ncbi:MAG: UpxY family transcription antiterminator [Desulfobacterales bacterium]|jgi:transcription elongation factor/antiterminator RfaH|nr:UpxY family transcription antiterminator [Desulfobacterales bacterium]
MSGDNLTPAWYVLHTKSRFENVVHDGLVKKSVDVFLPKALVQSKRKDRKKMIRVPLFPGYLFVKTDLNPYAYLEILKTVGAVRLIGNKNEPISVANDVIDSLKIMVSGEFPIETGNRFQPGDRVVVLSGPFTGIVGIFVRYKGSGRVIVNVEALGQYAAVEVDAQDVEIQPAFLS